MFFSSASNADDAVDARRRAIMNAPNLEGVHIPPNLVSTSLAG